MAAMYRSYSLLIVFFLLVSVPAKAQELFPMAESASSTPPKGAFAVRMFGETYNEIDRIRNLFALKVTYGLTSRLTVSAIPNISNHHNKELPPEFPDHNTPQIGVSHPYLFNGIDFYAKYRVFGIDGEKSHFRVALYGEYSILGTAHDEAEPTLLDDTRGYGGGFITTYLLRHFAASFTGGIILPVVYYGTVPDIISVLPGVPARVTYGNGYNYDLSFGYLLFPAEYTGYRQANWNIYMEFLGKSYGAAQVQVANLTYKAPYYTLSTQNNHALQAGNYVELYPGIQTIIKSNLRIDFSVGFPIADKSYAHFYPVYNFGIQRYLYFKRKNH